MIVMRRLGLVVAVAAVLLIAVACLAGETRIDVSYGDFVEDIDVARTVEVTPGTGVEVNLFTNPQSGFQWEEAVVSDADVLRLRDRRFLPLYGEPSPEERPSCLDSFTFEATGKGQSTVMFRYSRPWEGGQRGLWTFTLMVNVV